MREMEIFSIDAHRLEHESVIRYPGVSDRSAIVRVKIGCFYYTSVEW